MYFPFLLDVYPTRTKIDTIFDNKLLAAYDNFMKLYLNIYSFMMEW